MSEDVLVYETHLKRVKRRLRAAGVIPPASEGRKADAEKDRWDLLPTRAVRSIVKVLTFGARKYAPNNWAFVADARERYYAAALRHLTAWYDGELLDICEVCTKNGKRLEDCKNCSGLPHLACAGCCILFLLGFEVGDVDAIKAKK